PELERLSARMAEIEGELEALRQRRDRMDPDAYLNEHQAVLLQLATVQQEIDRAQAALDESPEDRSIDVMRRLLPLLLAALAPAAFGLTIEYGERPEPLAECDLLAYRGERSAASTSYPRLRASDDLALRAEAARELGDFRGANDAFRQAVQQAPDDATLRARWGYLFLDT